MAHRLAELSAELGQVRLLAVSKGQPPQRIAEAAALGLRHFAESYLQEARQKMPLFADKPLQWHFIGKIQRNKADRIGATFDSVDSLHRLELVPLLLRRRQSEKPLSVCLQLKFAGQADSRGGAPAAQIAELAQAVAEQDGLRLRGLMCMASPDPARARHQFAECRTLFDDLQRKYPQMDSLSMGTSTDWRAAVQCGSTQVRIGEALFGPRPARRHSETT